MTIGVAAYGASAGAAVRQAVLGAEWLGRGAIGGFAVFAIIDAAGDVHYRTGQRGGIGALDIPASWQDARIAAVISSGPDRPEPLTQFVPADGDLGLVTGHRTPQRPTAEGVPVNQAVLQLMRDGLAPQASIDQVLSACAQADAGLIAVDRQGRLGWSNAARVSRRDDLGEAHRDNGQQRIALLHNSIVSTRSSTQALADDLLDIAWSAMTRTPGRFAVLHLPQPLAIGTGERDIVHIDDAGEIQAIVSGDAFNQIVQRAKHTAIYLGAEVQQHGRRVGVIDSELFASLGHGVVTPLPGEAASRCVMRRDAT